jgi:hypothetical protein
VRLRAAGGVLLILAALTCTGTLFYSAQSGLTMSAGGESFSLVWGLRGSGSQQASFGVV